MCPPSDRYRFAGAAKGGIAAGFVGELLALSPRRANLIRQVLQNVGAAGFGDKQGQYKHLITDAVGVKEDDVEGM